jgi:putative ATPase
MEVVMRLYKEVNIDTILKSANALQLRYDKKGEDHFNSISAFIKSMRASQPNATAYYLMRMINGGEDPLYIARRMVIFASEDVGLADKGALVIANNVFQACQVIGYPECAINMMHGALYLAKCKKDRRVVETMEAVESDIKRYGNLPIPLKIRNATTKLMKSWGYNKGYYKYDTDDYLPDKVKGKKYFEDK